MEALEDKAQGLFIYARLLDHHLYALESKLEKGQEIDLKQICGLPAGLDEIYITNFKQPFPDSSGCSWLQARRLVALIMVQQEPMPVRLAH